MQTKNEKAIKANGISEYVEIKDCKAIYKKKKEKEVARGVREKTLLIQLLFIFLHKYNKRGYKREIYQQYPLNYIILNCIWLHV